MVGFIPPEVLSILRTAVDFQFDDVVDWYRAGEPGLHADRQYSPQPVQIPARILETTREYYEQGGQQATVQIRLVYLPWDYAVQIKPLDKIVMQGVDASKHWPTVIEVTPLPSAAEPVLARVRQGAA